MTYATTPRETQRIEAAIQDARRLRAEYFRAVLRRAVTRRAGRQDAAAAQA